MNRRKLYMLGAFGIAIIAFSWFEAAVRNNGGEKVQWSDASRIDLNSLPALPPVAESIRFFENRVADNPQDGVSLTLLGQLYLRQARESGDVSYYERADAALLGALEKIPGYKPAKVAYAGSLYAQHNFEDALQLALEIYQRDSKRFDALAIIGDAHLALGHYEEADAALQTLKEWDLTPASLARLSYRAELLGDLEGALDLIERAASRSYELGQSRQDLAWYLIRMADLQFKSGMIDEAAESNQAALQVLPEYHLALAGLGKVRAAQEQYHEAIQYYERAVAVIPQPEFLAALGDLYLLTGQPEEARIQFDTVELIGKLARINQQVYNRQLANFYADHNIHLQEALDLALAELAYRKDIYGYDTAAWAYYKNGMFSEAQAMSEQALRLGTRDARLYYHAGMIALALGDRSEARGRLAGSLELNPRFDPLQAQVARTALEQLQKP